MNRPEVLRKHARLYLSCEAEGDPNIRLLGELRATQAIDLLVKYVDYNDGTAGLSLSHIPAAQALVQIGDPSVPKLRDALRHGNSVWTGDRSIYRFAAAAALGEMHRQDPAN